jgi:hypothetical protein
MFWHYLSEPYMTYRLKCDRGLPCETCARRGLSLSCTYPASTPLQSGKRLIDPSSTALHKRIAQLEKLVVSMTNGTDSTVVKENKDKTESDLPDDSTKLLPSFGRIGLENTETNYVENSHWTAVLDGVWYSTF